MNDVTSCISIGIVRSQSIGYWVLGAELGIVLTLIFRQTRFNVITMMMMMMMMSGRDDLRHW